jgi:Pyruvate/2-oxoglutarate dehydrogenase complex, dihydrolipoamide acyltransferase (E2) component, and related enzymes
VVKNYVNLGIAAATPRGLMVPNIEDPDQMSLRGWHLASSARPARVRANSPVTRTQLATRSKD